MKRLNRKYVRSNPLDTYLLQKDRQSIREYGLRNKKELKRVRAMIRNYQWIKRERSVCLNDVVVKLKNLGVIAQQNSELIYSLKPQNFLDRRLQTIVSRKFSISPSAARQKVVHGHVKVNGVKKRHPSYLIRVTSQVNLEGL